MYQKNKGICISSYFIIQNDFEIFGFKVESKDPVPIDSLITNFAETAYVVSVSTNYISMSQM